MQNQFDVSKQKHNIKDNTLEKPQLRFPEFKENWNLIKLEDNAIIKGRIGWKNLKSEEYTEEGPSLIAGKHINNGTINWDECDHITTERYNESPEIALQNGDIIFSKDGSLGNPALIKNLNQKATINGTMMLVRLNNLINPNYFYQVLNSDYFFRLLHILKSGSSIPHIFQRDMINFKFPICSFEEQKKIAYFLECIDKKIELLEKVLVQYKLEFNYYLNFLMFSNNSKEWDNYSVNECCEVITGFPFKSKEYLEEGTYKVVRGDNVKKGFTKWDEKTRCWNELSDNLQKFLLKENDIVISMDGNVGRNIAVLSDDDLPALLAQRVACVRAKDNFNQNFIKYALISNNFKRYVDSLKTGSTIHHISLKQINEFSFRIPSIESQDLISSFLYSLERRNILLEENIGYMKKFKKGLLQNMFV